MDTQIPTHVVFIKAWVKNEEGKYLLAKRSSKDDQNPAAWSVPGGKVEKDISDNVIEQTLAKEVFEEVGIKIDNINYLSSRMFVRSSGDTVVAMSFTADYVSGEAKPLEDQDEVQWVSRRDLPIYLHQEHWSNTLYKLP